MNKTLLTAALAISLGGCASAQESARLAQTVAAAEQEVAAAKKANAGLWSDTADMLKEAKDNQDLAFGDKPAAMKKASKALTEAKLAQKQAQENAKAKPFYPEN